MLCIACMADCVDAGIVLVCRLSFSEPLCVGVGRPPLNASVASSMTYGSRHTGHCALVSSRRGLLWSAPSPRKTLSSAALRSTHAFLLGCVVFLDLEVIMVAVWTVQPSGLVAVQKKFAEDRRVLVISWLVGGRMTCAEAAELNGVSVVTAGRWFRGFRRTGALLPDDALG